MFRLLSAMSLVALFAVASYAQAPSAQKSKPATPPAQAKPPAIVNLNTATAAELEQLPGVGARTAERIIEYRQKKGPFKKVEELMNVQGIGEKSFLKLKSQITVASKPESAAGQ